MREPASFTRVEHPIPESLGNDDLTLEAGFVCDSCNQYFGSKVELPILASPPFGIERVGQAIRTKKRRLPLYRGDGFALVSSGCWDATLVVATDDDHIAARQILETGYVVVVPPSRYGDLIARFLLKVGLELMLTAENGDPYASAFDLARRCARVGVLSGEWDVAYGVYPNRERLKVSSRSDELGQLETRQIYQYEMGVMESGDVILCFIFVNHVFACNLSRPPMTEYLMGFNAHNDFSLSSRWTGRNQNAFVATVAHPKGARGRQ